MTKETSSKFSLLGIFYKYPRFMQSLGWLGSISVLSSGIVVAQTNSPKDSVGVAPSNTTPSSVKPTNSSASSRAKLRKPNLKPGLLDSPPSRTPQGTPARRRLETPASTGNPANVSVREPQNSVSTPPETARPRRAVVRLSKPTLTSPDLSVPTQASVSKPPKITINPSQRQENAQKPVNSNNRNRNRTNYRVGSSGSYSKPSAVVLTERSTGCTTTSRNGRLASGSCSSQPPHQTTARIRQPRNQTVARRRPQPLQQPGNETVANRPNKPAKFSVNEPVDNPSVNIAINRRLNQPLANRTNIATGSSRNEPLNPSVNPTIANQPNQPLTRQVNQDRIAEAKLPAPPVTKAKSVRFAPITASANPTQRKRRHQVFSGKPSVPSALVPSTSLSIPSAQTAPMGLDYYDLTRRPIRQPNIAQASFMFPLTIPAPITSLFGWRLHPISGQHRFHGGTDLGAPQGTPVIAAVSGEVATADYLGGYGLAVVIRHEEGTQESLYGHLSEVFVKQGDLVNQGTVIGRVGSTGFSTGPHLHFEWRQLTPNGWVAVDAGAHLEYGLAQFMKALQVAQAPQVPQLPQLPQLQSYSVPTAKIPIEIAGESSKSGIFGEISGVETIGNLLEEKQQ